MEHRIGLPLCLQRVYLQPPEQFLLPGKVSLKGGDEQTLAEPARTAEKVCLSVVRERIYHVRLVDIDIGPPIQKQ